MSAPRPSSSRRLPARAGAAAAAVLVLSTAACGGGADSGGPAGSSAASPSAAGSASSAGTTPSIVAPQVGQCHRLAYADATRPTDSSSPVDCGDPHTSVTVFVGRLSQLSGGHLLAVDSDAVQRQVARACPGKLAGFVGGDQETQRLSRFEMVWFSPTVDQADAGADWFRCDLVSLRGQDDLGRLPGDVQGALARAGALDRFGTCGNKAPDKPGFTRTLCAQPHSWQAVSTVDIARSARYLGAAATATGDAACKDVASDRADGALTYTWSFEWPARPQWNAGQRYGYCWVPGT